MSLRRWHHWQPVACSHSHIASPLEAKHSPVIVFENDCSAIDQTPTPTLKGGGGAPLWRGHNCLVNPNGDCSVTRTASANRHSQMAVRDLC